MVSRHVTTLLLVAALGINLNECALRRAEQCSRGRCDYIARCKNHVWKFCSLASGFTGICCEDGQLFRTPVQHVSHSPPRAKPSALDARETIQIEQNQIKRFVESLHHLEDELVGNEIVPNPNSEDFSHQNFFGTNSQVLSEMQTAEQVLQAFINFAKREKLSVDDIRRGRWNVRNTSLAEVCPANPSCDNKVVYRQPDGTCNNLIDTSQGQAISTYARLLPAEYADGVNAPRVALDGSELPNPRFVSLHVALDAPIDDNRYTLLLMQFGQFVDHDITRTALTRTYNGSQISCCDDRVLENPRLRHPACFEIPVPEADLFLRSHGQKCINFVRSSPSISPKCRFGPREQLNQLSSYIDGNQIYGPSILEETKLRSFRDGKLKIEEVNNEEFLPFNHNSSMCKIPKHLRRKCFLSGDIRANEVPDLVVLHVLFHREHNRIADLLSQMNVGWNDEIVFQETKRIVIAQLQHIVYNEFLPLVLGEKTIQHFGLGLAESYSESYNSVVDATILNEFATAAYRLHSLVQGTLNFNAPSGEFIGQVSIENMFSNPEILYEAGIIEMRVAGLTAQAIRSFDGFFSKELTNHLFQMPGKRWGLDLVALNIQRGRDHGLPGYVKYRHLCGLSPVDSFQDLSAIVSDPEVIYKLEQLYTSVEDVDLFIGGTLERPLTGAIVGPTFACILGEQFRRLKQGDRFWYENADQRIGFTENQLKEIKKVTMARILCDNSHIGVMQPLALLMPTTENPKVACATLPRMNLADWMQH